MANNARLLGAQTAAANVRGKILIVDDESDSRQIFRDMLSGLGYDVIDASSGLSALLTIRDQGVIDLVITDYQMPDMNGLEFVEQVRRLLPVVPIIMITAYGSIETYIRSQCLSVFEYINKPVQKREFNVIVKAALNNHTNRHEGLSTW
jgi:DNA-binding NtrC family response regulator